MRFLPTRVHGIIDYVVGVFLIFSPYLLGFADGTAAQWIPMLLGASAILYSIFTRYEWGIFRFIPMQAHLGLDALSGLFFIISPWLFAFADHVLWPHVILGLFEVVASLVTRTTPEST